MRDTRLGSLLYYLGVCCTYILIYERCPFGDHCCIIWVYLGKTKDKGYLSRKSVHCCIIWVYLGKTKDMGYLSRKSVHAQ